MIWMNLIQFYELFLVVF